MDRFLSGPAPARPVSGVNVAGYLRTESGVGSAIRAYLQALRAGPLPLALIDLSDLSGNRAGDRSVGASGREYPHDINLICADIDLHFAVLSRLGPEFFRDRYNIAIWAWELPRFPERWSDRFAYYDEIWVGTSFIANLLAPVSPIPVVRVPPVLTPPVAACRAAGRRRLRLAPDEFTFLFVFDFHSRWQRKNPLGVVEAFRRAFEPADRVRLILKCVNPGFDRPAFEALRARAAGYPITIYSDYWTGAEMQDLMAACDAYVSLHRSEGTGLTMAEAMVQGKPVIATAWSGNLDFMDISNSFLVRADLVEIEADAGQYAAGETWAEPAIDHAAELMRHVFTHRADAAARGRAARRSIEARYSVAAISQLIRERLGVIAARRDFARLKRGLQAPIADVEAFIADHAAVARYVPAQQLRYQRLVQRLRDAVRAVTPPDATVIVVSRGDDDFLQFEGRHGRHFPQTAAGVYAGHYPATAGDAIDHLEALRESGGDYLLIPATAAWWLDHYPDFARHLGRYRRVWDDEAGIVFDLSRALFPPAGEPGRAGEAPGASSDREAGTAPFRQEGI